MVPCRLQADVTQVLPLVLEHGLITNPATVCSLLPVSRALKQTLVSCQPCLEVLICSELESLGKVSGFASWLRRYGHLVRTLSYTPSLSDQEGVSRACETMISLGFSLAAASGVPLGLQSFEAENGCCSPAILASLPASSITYLELAMTPAQIAIPSLPLIFQEFNKQTNKNLRCGNRKGLLSRNDQTHHRMGPKTMESRPPSKRNTQADIQLCNLQELSLRADGSKDGRGPWGQLGGGEQGGVLQLSVGFLSSALYGLTSLKDVALRTDGWNWPSLQGLPPSLEILKLRTSGAECLLDIAHLTSLRTLQLQAEEGIAEGSSLPPSLHAATFLDTPLTAHTCSLLSALQQLSVGVTSEHPSDSLLGLSGLPNLQELSLTYTRLPSAAAAAAAWASLPQLRALEVQATKPALETEWAAVLTGIGTAKSLTSLSLVLRKHPDWISLHHVVQLQNLQALTLAHCGCSREDMLQLRRLTQLTALELKWCNVDDATAMEVLGSLTGLQSLVLRNTPLFDGSDSEESSEDYEENIVTDAIVPFIKYQLKGLKELYLHVPGVTDRSLRLLEGLSQLSKLCVGGLTGPSLDQLKQVLVGCEVIRPERW